MLCRKSGEKMRTNNFHTIVILPCRIVNTLWSIAFMMGLVLFIVIKSARAATYYVDENHHLASDSNPGTQNLPWLTIQHAADVAEAEDVVYVKEGIYNERVVPQNSGETGKKITFKALPRRSVTMWGFYTIYSDYLRIEGFKITTDSSLTGWTERYGIFIRSNYVEVVDNYFYDMVGTIQGYWGDPWPKMVYIADNRIYYCQSGIGIIGYNWLVENNEIERLIQRDGGDCDYSRFFGENIIIRNNYFHGTKMDEIGSAHVDFFQTFDNNGEHVRNIIIENNVGYTCHQGFMGSASYYNNSSDIVFRNNVFAHCWAWGLCVHEIKNIRAVHNVFVDIEYHGAGFRSGATGIVRNNIFYDGGSNYWASQGGSVTGSRNLLYRTSGSIDTSDYPNDIVNVDPIFVNSFDNDYRLQESSPAIDSGAPLTAVHEDDIGSGIILKVADAGYFQDGWGMQDIGVQSDWIAIGEAYNVVQISSIDFETNIITLESPISRSDGDPVWLYKDSDGTRVLYGSAPDIGAYEYGQHANNNGYLVVVYPNPCRVYRGENIITFSGDLSAGDNIKIFDMGGKIVHNSGNLLATTYQWNVSEIASGIYLFVVKSADGQKQRSGKIVIIR